MSDAGGLCLLGECMLLPPSCCSCSVATDTEADMTWISANGDTRGNLDVRYARQSRRKAGRADG
jgi:hypothetical protein